MVQDNIKIIKQYLQLINERTFYVIGLFVSSICGHATDLLLPMASAQIIDLVTIKAFNGAFIWVLLLGIFYIIYNGSWYFNYRFYVANYEHIHKDLQSRLLNKISTLDNEFYEKISKGKILNTNATDLENLSDLIDIVCEFFIVTIKIIIIALIFLKTNVYIGLFVLLLNIFYINVLDINNKQGSIHLEGQKKYSDKITDTLSQTLEGLDEVQTYNLMPKLNKKFNLFENKWKEQYTLRYKYVTRQNTVLPNIINLGKCVLYALLIILVIKERIGVDALILLISYYELLITESTQLMSLSKTLRDNSISIKRFDSILNYKRNKKIDFGDNNNDYIYGLVEFKKVSYFNKNKKILSNLDLKFEPNKITAILGQNGSGKTSIVNLLLRKIKLDTGRILIDGTDIYDYNPEIYHNNVTSVSNNSYIFNMSIRDNLALVDSKEKNQIEVCKRLGIHDFIMKLPNGYNTVLNENNNEVTEEKRLLITIARSLLTKAEIILFDEVTNILESSTITKFIELCEDLKLDHTIVLLTREKRIAKYADKIYLLKNGKIVAEGTDKELKKKNDYYNSIENNKIKKKVKINN